MIEAKDGLANEVVAAKSGVEQHAQLVRVQRCWVAEAIGYGPGLQSSMNLRKHELEIYSI